MAEAKKKNETGTLLAEKGEDLALEKIFLKEIGDKRPEGLKDGFQILLAVYNEVNEQLVRWQMDVDTYIGLEVKEPWNSEWTKLKEQAARELRGRRVTLKAVRENLKEAIFALK